MGGAVVYVSHVGHRRNAQLGEHSSPRSGRFKARAVLRAKRRRWVARTEIRCQRPEDTGQTGRKNCCARAGKLGATTQPDQALALSYQKRCKDEGAGDPGAGLGHGRDNKIQFSRVLDQRVAGGLICHRIKYP